MLDIHCVEVFINLIKNQNIVITGTSSGVGLELTKIFLKSGNKVWGCSRKNSKISHKNYFHSKIDLIDISKTKKWLMKVQKQSKNKIDIFLNNAAEFKRSLNSFEKFNSIERTVKINLIAPMILTNIISKLMMKNKKGIIIFFSSVAVDVKQIGSSSYSATKSGLEVFSEIINKELKNFNIKVATLRILYTPSKLSNQLNKTEIKSLVKKYRTNKYKNKKNIFNEIERIFIKKNLLKKNIFFDSRK